MLFAFLTTLLWSFSAIFARKLVQELGSTLANVCRLSLAALLLSTWAFTGGQGLGGKGLVWFLVSGIAGFGLGDIGLYFALSRLGSRLTILLTQALAAPIGALIEWLWLGTALSSVEILWGAGILGGVALALVPRDNAHIEPQKLASGIGWGLVAALGQGLGAVLSRRAFAVSQANGLLIDGGTAAFQRVTGGILVVAAAWYLTRNRPDERALPFLRDRLAKPRFLALLAASSLFGPVVGVACYQQALATAPSGLVMLVVALSPVVIIPFSWWLEGDRPRPRSLLGGALAVACAIGLATARTAS